MPQFVDNQAGAQTNKSIASAPGAGSHYEILGIVLSVPDTQSALIEDGDATLLFASRGTAVWPPPGLNRKIRVASNKALQYDSSGAVSLWIDFESVRD